MAKGNREFEVGDFVFMKVPLWKEVMRFRKKGKFSLRYVELFEILDRVGMMAYRVALPPQLSNVRNVLHNIYVKEACA